MDPLLACPFCRELFTADEAAICEDCGVKLVPMSELPPTQEALEEAAIRGELDPPEDCTLPWTFWGRGRGSLLLCGLCGLASFFAPWVEFSRPEEILVSGYDLARTNAGWLWGGAVGWFVTLPLVFTRRTVMRMRGVRAITAAFAAMTLGEVLMLLFVPPAQSRLVPFEFRFAWGLFGSGLTSLIGVFFALRLGGSLRDLSDLGQAAAASTHAFETPPSSRTLH